MIGALGIVYGDIGTSPLYSIKECFSPLYGLDPVPENIFGILSLVFWSITLIVVLKYITFIMKADNQGQGGIMALMALLKSKKEVMNSSLLFLISCLAVFGTALLLSDGMITPAISVLSALEGLEVVTPMLKPFIIPITLIILILLFLFQKKGTETVSNIFGPVMLLWFVVLGGMGLYWIFHSPRILNAVNPLNILEFVRHHHWRAFSVLGSVVLCVTGAEALYADMGHFGKKPITMAWYRIVYPCLLLNYFGQGAILLIRGKTALHNPFYEMVPSVFLIPLVILSTLATIIASQALISGAYSVGQQAIQLGYCPRMHIRHTSSATHGQIYIPEINLMLMIACCGLVLLFKTSSNLAAAYGIAVTGTMTITTLLFYYLMKKTWKWHWSACLFLTGLFLFIDLLFLFSNLGKVFHGGWVPLVIGFALYFIMATWQKGRSLLKIQIEKSLYPLNLFVSEIKNSEVSRVKGTAVFMTSNMEVVPPVMLHHIKHNKSLHERVVFLRISTESVPEVPADKKICRTELSNGFHQLTASYGFMENPTIPEIFRLASQKNFFLNLQSTSFYLGRENLIIRKKTKMARWRKQIFSFISRNAPDATAYYEIPPGRVVELGAQIEI